MMENQIDKDLLRQIAALAAPLADKEAADFTLAWENGLVLRTPQGERVMRFPAPVRAGQVLNFLARRARQPRIDSLPEEIAIGPYRFFPRQSVLKDETDTPIELTDKERDLLAALLCAPGQALEREALLAEVWAYAQDVETHTLETHIYRLRRKIEQDPAMPRWLVNEDGLYKLKG